MISPEVVEIHSEWIKLDAFLKFSGLCETGGEAKIAVQNGEICVNGENCTQRGRKLYPGDKVTFEEKSYVLQKGGEKL